MVEIIDQDKEFYERKIVTILGVQKNRLIAFFCVPTTYDLDDK